MKTFIIKIKGGNEITVRAGSIMSALGVFEDEHGYFALDTVISVNPKRKQTK